MTASELFAVMMIFSGGKHEGRANDLAHYLLDAAYESDVSPVELAAIAWKESSYRVHAVGKAGELGALQVAPSSLKTWCEGRRVGHVPTKIGHVRCGAYLFALARAKCPTHPFTAYHTPSHCGPSQYETRIRNTLKKAGL